MIVVSTDPGIPQPINANRQVFFVNGVRDRLRDGTCIARESGTRIWDKTGFVRGLNGELFHSYQLRPNGLWGGVVTLGGQLQTDPIVATNIVPCAHQRSGTRRRSW